jgi:glutaredoxin
MRTVVLYGREGCCLCDDARVVLERVRARHPFALHLRDIDADPALLRAYLERIPVVTIDGDEAFELFVDEAQLERLVAPGDPRSSLSRVHPDELHGRPR